MNQRCTNKDADGLLCDVLAGHTGHHYAWRLMCLGDYRRTWWDSPARCESRWRECGCRLSSGHSGRHADSGGDWAVEWDERAPG